MSVTISVNDASVDLVASNLAKLSDAVNKKINRGAVQAMAKPICDLMKDMAPVDEENGPGAGQLKKSIGIVIRVKGQKCWAYIGPRYGFKIPINLVTRGKNKGLVEIQSPTRYASLQEFGSKHQMARPFVRPAWDEMGGDTAIANYIEAFISGVQDAVNGMKGQIYK